MTAKRDGALPVIYAPIALQELDAIWGWNEQHHSLEHAAQYIDFLEWQIGALGQNYSRGRVIPSHPKLRYILIRRKAGGHGHIAVYRVDDEAVSILHVFHSAQDWQAELATERPAQS